ncbi:MAG: RNA polymerase sigma factor [Bryobacterales bacterium]|nr:RNA polymerase sigma factor [Bryobacterales bacterium]MDE0293755.1 RNA polymerase sigma factor [Bryobacterales bacterium]MDE0434921.1 RNA polymerase sigma factor [Bryobacterales bacterium]
MTLDSAAMIESFINSGAAAAGPGEDALTTPLQAIEEAAFHRLYEQLAPALRAYVLRICEKADLADDVVQDAFVKYLRTPIREMDETAAKAYLYRIATNLVNDHWRRRERERKWSWKAIFRKPAEAKLDLRGDMARQFGRLAPRERALLWLAYVEGFDHEEIARVLKVRPKSIRVMLFRARKKLRKLLDSEGTDMQ